MKGISPAIPLDVSHEDGLFKLNKTTVQVARQNLKMLLLTSPGERVMNPDFGVGVRNFLFENNRDMAPLYSRIMTQAAAYVPFINITDLLITPPSDGLSGAPNTLQIRIAFSIRNSSGTEEFNMTL